MKCPNISVNNSCVAVFDLLVIALSLYYTEITIIVMKYKGEIFVKQTFLAVWYLYVYIYIILY